MKYFFYILIPLLVCFQVTFGQYTITPLLSDPHRQTTTDNINNGLRVSGASSVAAIPQVKDTLELPFFDDFTSTAAAVAFVNNPDSALFPQSIVSFQTFGLHGLNTGDKIYVISDTTAFLKFASGRRYVRRISPIIFELYQTSDLTDSLKGNGNAFNPLKNPIWIRENVAFSPNPDSLKWKKGGGVYINNRFGVDPPSYNVATFDGLNSNGKSYSGSLAHTVGNTDSLTSLPINLKPVQASDSLYLSFYYQRAGLGEAPDSEDSLYLQFKNKLGVWKYIWSMKGNGDSGRFNQSMILIKDPLYFYKGFQFRFISHGEKDGSFDVWNLDYIHLDSSRSISDKTHTDGTIQKSPISLLKKYTSMPIEQFFIPVITDLKDTLSFTLNNLGTAVEPYASTDRLTLFDEIGNRTLQSYPLLSQTQVPSLGRLESKIVINSTGITKQDPYFLKLKYTLKYTFDNILDKGVSYRTNDSISGYSNLKDYYAYDDSTAEWGFSMNEQGSKVAVEFDLNIPDTLVAIDMYFPHIEKDYAGSPLDLIVWSQILPMETQLGKTSVALTYTGNNNQYKRFKLANEILVKDSVFVGYQQGVKDAIPIGLDLNTNSVGKRWHTVRGVWAMTTITGSVMIRPVFKNRGSIISGIFNPVQPQAVLDCEVFPNPTTGTLNILGDIKDATLTDLSGKVLLEQKFTSQDIYKTMELQNIPAGFYLLRLSNDKASAVKKIVLVK